MNSRYAYWVPLVLLGFLLLGVLGLRSLQHRAQVDFGWFGYEPASGMQFLSPEQYTVVGTMVGTYGVGYRYSADMSFGLWDYYSARGWSWALVVLVTFLAAVVWYGWRARRAGSAVTVRTLVLLASVGVLAIALSYLVAGVAETGQRPAELVTSVGIPMALLGVIAGAWWYFRLGPGVRVAAVVSVVSLLVGGCTVVGSLMPHLVDPLIIAVGLLALAWLERSVLLAVVAVTVFAVMAAFPSGDPSLLFPAVVLLGGGIAALVLRARPATGTIAG